jgi:hypothetical protein
MSSVQGEENERLVLLKWTKQKGGERSSRTASGHMFRRNTERDAKHTELRLRDPGILDQM